MRGACVCVSVRMFVCMSLSACLSVRLSGVSGRVKVCMCVFVYVTMHACTYVYIRMCICMYIYMYVRTYVYMYVW